ncbi:MAG: GHKL domain-containing protein [Clostridia bacterium]|nr:GHKL domain-containing protein [Clostridia bacterium]
MTLPVRILMAIEATLCYVPGLLLRVAPFGQKLTYKQKWMLFITYPTLLLLNILFLFLGLKDFETATVLIRLDMLLIQVILVGVNLIVIKGFLREHIFTFGVVATCMYMLLAIATYFPPFFENLNILSQYFLGTGIYIILMCIAYLPIKILLKKTISPFLSEKGTNYWKSVWFIPLLMYVAMFTALPIDQSVETFTMLFSRVLISISIIIFTTVVASNHRNLIEKQALTDHLSMSKMHYAGLQTKMEAARKANHDLKHMLHLIRCYIDNDDKNGLIDFCNTLETDYLINNRVPYTGNAAVDGVIYHYMKKSDEHQIDFQYTGGIQGDYIADIDLCILLGNALDNAVAGCLTLETDRKIIMKAKSHEKNLVLMIENTFDGDIKRNSEQKILSRKQENRVGVGLTSMKEICERYHGTLTTEWEDHTFRVYCVLTENKKLF